MEYYSAIEKNKPLIHTTMGLPCGSDGKESPLMRDIWVWSLVRKMPWRRERLPTPVLWAGEFHGLYIPWDCKEPDTTEQLSLSHNYETEFHKHYGMTEAKPQRIIFCWYEVLELSEGDRNQCCGCLWGWRVFTRKRYMAMYSSDGKVLHFLFKWWLPSDYIWQNTLFSF